MCFWALHFVWMCWPLAKAVAAHTALGSAQRRCLSHPHGFCIPPTCVPLAAWSILVFPHTLLFHVLKYFQYGNVSNAMSASHCSGKVVLYFWGIKRAVISYTAMVGTKSPRGWLWHLALRGNPFAWFSLWLMQRDSMVPIGWGGLVWPVMTPHKNGHGKLPEEASQVEILHPSGCCLQRRELGRETKLPPKVLVEDQQPAGPTTSFLPNAFPLLLFFFSYHIHGKNWCHCREGKKSSWANLEVDICAPGTGKPTIVHMGMAHPELPSPAQLSSSLGRCSTPGFQSPGKPQKTSGTAWGASRAADGGTTLSAARKKNLRLAVGALWAQEGFGGMQAGVT